VDVSVWLNLCIALLTAALAVFAFVQAKAATDSRRDALGARDGAEAAQAEATRVAAEARDALLRSAAALERSNEIAEDALPTPQVHWQLRSTGKSRYIVVNDGQLTALDVALSGNEGIYVDQASRSDRIVPGDSLEFHLVRGMGMPTSKLTITWTPEGQSEPTDVTIAVR